MEPTIQHYGILGMKWGIRRERGPDGRVASSKDYKESRQLMKKPTKEMSNAELNKVVSRLRLEQQYSQLNQSSVSKGRQIAAKTLTRMGNRVVDRIIDRNIDRIGAGITKAAKDAAWNAQFKRR